MYYGKTERIIILKYCGKKKYYVVVDLYVPRIVGSGLINLIFQSVPTSIVASKF